MSKLFPTLLCGLVFLAPVEAKKGKGRGHGDATVVEVAVFRTEDRRAIVDYYRATPSGLPPGLAKRDGDLPPGLAKQLRRNGRLPPGLEKRIVVFPVELDRRLPPPPAGCVRGIIGGRAVIFNPGTSLIVDVFAVF